MTVIEFFSKEATRIIGYFHDLLLFIRAPKQYLNEISALDYTESIFRIVIYSLAFTLIELGLFSLIGHAEKTISTYNVFGVLILEIIFGVIIYPSFLCSAKYLKIENFNKVSLHYAIVYRFIYLTPILIFYALFLITENYSFAIIRSVLFYFGYVIYLLVFPISQAKSLKTGFIAVVLTFLTAFSISFGISVINDLIPLSFDNTDRLSVLYDPIFKEVQKIDIKFGTTTQSDPYKEIRFELFTLANPLKSQEEKDSLRKKLNNFHEIKSLQMNQIEDEEKRLNEVKPNLIFNTSKQLLEYRLKELSMYKHSLNKLDEFIQIPNPEGILESNKLIIETNSLIIQGLALQNQVYSTQIKMLEWWVIL